MLEIDKDSYRLPATVALYSKAHQSERGKERHKVRGLFGLSNTAKGFHGQKVISG